MNDASLAKVSRIKIPRQVINETLDFLQKHGNKHVESHALLVGKEAARVFSVSDVWFPKQRGTSCYYEVPEEEVFQINKRLNLERKTAICQVHTHPCGAFHSGIDDDGSALMLPGSVSIVIPNFGFVPREELNRWEVYRLEDGIWQHISEREVKRLFRIT